MEAREEEGKEAREKEKNSVVGRTCDDEHIVRKHSIGELILACATYWGLVTVTLKGFDFDGFFDAFGKVTDASGCTVWRVEDCGETIR